MRPATWKPARASTRGRTSPAKSTAALLERLFQAIQESANQALRAVETARYRPRLVDGQPADTPEVRFVQPFYVPREDKPTPQGGGG
jgi:hypothetical protein